ncbi:MAG TPA: DUF4294 domain-containing protein [Bacteroidales bacterium]|nr:DUF4294 domain-containing protein [Bacteroidales bacterium]
MRWIVFILFISVLLPVDSKAQEPVRPGENEHSITGMTPMVAKVENGDTLIMQNLKPVLIYGWQARPDRKTRRLIRNVKKAYPYARLASIKLHAYNEKLKAANTDRERRRLMRKAEKELKEQYGDDLKKLTFTQGHILLKLIDRETGETSYELVEELRGKFTAFFWQSFARIFGFNMKRDYDPDGEDKRIEQIVLLIENGQL